MKLIFSEKPLDPAAEMGAFSRYWELVVQSSIFLSGEGGSIPQKNLYLLKFLCKPSKRRLDGQ